MQNTRASPTPTSVAVLRRRTAVFIITVVVSAPFALFLVVLGLVVVEFVIFPTATLATGVIAALVAGWAASKLAGDGYRTDIGAVAWRNRLGHHSGGSLTVPGCAVTWLAHFGCRLLHGSWSHTLRFPPPDSRHVDSQRPSDYCRLVGRDRDRSRLDHHGGFSVRSYRRMSRIGAPPDSGGVRWDQLPREVPSG